MSSKHTIPVLTRANYEEAFLLYVDNELTPVQKAAVDAFVQQHPDLKEELELLCSTTFAADDLQFVAKDALFSESMKLHTVDESLLLYIDNELPADEVKTVEAQLQTDKTFALQHALLLKTKLDPTEHVIYPNKEELYRRTERRIVPYWLRIAAAVMIIAGAGTAAWMGFQPSATNNTTVAVNTNPKPAAPQASQAPPTVIAKPEQTLAKAEAAPKVTTVTKAVGRTSARPALRDVAVAKKGVPKKPIPTFSKSHAAEEPVLDQATIATRKSNNLPVDESTIATKKIVPVLPKTGVTSDGAVAYVPIDATAKTSVPVTAAALEEPNERSGGSVKGFLRKATRFIERRTGIKTVNDDDELLVGAVALKL